MAAMGANEVKRLVGGFALGVAAAVLVGLAVATIVLRPWERGCAGRSVAEIQQSGALRVGYALEPPHSYRVDDEVVGHSADLARRVAAELGIANVQWRLAEFHELIPLLEAGEIDMVAAGMFVTPERRLRVAFSRPTALVHPGLLVRRGNPLDLQSYTDLARHPTARVGVLAGAVEEADTEVAGIPEARVLVLPDAQAGLGALLNDEIEALALSMPSLRWLEHREGVGAEVEAVACEECFVDEIAFAFRLDDECLRLAWDEQLGRVMAEPAYEGAVAEAGLKLPGKRRP